MKKVILTLILGLTISLISIAQVNKHSIGVFTGGGLSNSANSIYSYGFGYNFGVTYNYRINNKFAIITGLDYDSRNSYYKNTITDTLGVSTNIDLKHKLDFISVPLILNTSFGNEVKYFINTGLSFTYLINYKQTSDIGRKTIVSNDKSYFNKFGIDLNIGIGVQFPLSDKVDLSVEARFKKGLIDIAKTPVEGSEKVTTSNALLLMGLHYKL